MSLIVDYSTGADLVVNAFSSHLVVRPEDAFSLRHRSLASGVNGALEVSNDLESRVEPQPGRLTKVVPAADGTESVFGELRGEEAVTGAVYVRLRVACRDD